MTVPLRQLVHRCLTVTEILRGLEELKARGMEDCFKLLHFHLTYGLERHADERIQQRELLGKRSVTADRAIRLERRFKMRARFWLHLQADYDLQTALNEERSGRRGARRTA